MTTLVQVDDMTVTRTRSDSSEIFKLSGTLDIQAVTLGLRRDHHHNDDSGDVDWIMMVCHRDFTSQLYYMTTSRRRPVASISPDNSQTQILGSRAYPARPVSEPAIATDSVL